MSPEEEIETLHRELAMARHERDIARASARGACDDLRRQMARTDELLRERRGRPAGDPTGKDYSDNVPGHTYWGD